MKKALTTILLTFLLFMSNVDAKEVKLDTDNYTIKPGGTVSLDIIIDSEDDIKSGSFKITTSSRYIGFDSIEFVDGITRTSSGSSYTFNVTKGTIKSGSKIATVTLKALDTTKEGAKTTIVLSSLKVKNASGKTSNFDTISQIVTCTNEEQSSNNNYLKEINSQSFKLEDFNKDKTSYEVEVEKIDGIEVTATAEDEKAEVKVEKNIDSKEIKIVVTAENSEVREYTIKLNEKEEVKETIKETKQEIKPASYKGKWIGICIVLGVIVAANVFLLKKDK